MGNCLPAGSSLSTPLIDGGPWTVTQDFGCTDFTSEEPNCRGCAYFHSGLDISGGSIAGKGVHTLAAGTIVHVGFVVGSCCLGCSSCGAGPHALCVRSGDLDFWYFHLAANYVGLGAQVTQGQVIGAVGTCGCSTGPHLHFQVEPAGQMPSCQTAVNPCPYLSWWPTSVSGQPGSQPQPGYTVPTLGSYTSPAPLATPGDGGGGGVDTALALLAIGGAGWLGYRAYREGRP